MPGGAQEAWPVIQPMLKSIAAKAEDGTPCCEWVGPGGAGHYVKMVHNGIEYADMQLIAESSLLMKHVGGIQNHQMAEVFNQWNQGELKSFLIGITADIFAEKDDLAAGELVDKIEDSAGQKGTGRWTSIQAMKQGGQYLHDYRCLQQSRYVQSSLGEKGLGRGFASSREN